MESSFNCSQGKRSWRQTPAPDRPQACGAHDPPAPGRPPDGCAARLSAVLHRGCCATGDLRAEWQSVGWKRLVASARRPKRCFDGGKRRGVNRPVRPGRTHRGHRAGLHLPVNGGPDIRVLPDLAGVEPVQKLAGRRFRLAVVTIGAVRFNDIRKRRGLLRRQAGKPTETSEADSDSVCSFLHLLLHYHMSMTQNMWHVHRNVCQTLAGCSICYFVTSPYCQRPGASWILANSLGRCFWSNASIFEAAGTLKGARRGYMRSFSQ